MFCSRTFRGALLRRRERTDLDPVRAEYRVRGLGVDRCLAAQECMVCVPETLERRGHLLARVQRVTYDLLQELRGFLEGDRRAGEIACVGLLYLIEILEDGLRLRRHHARHPGDLGPQPACGIEARRRRALRSGVREDAVDRYRSLLRRFCVCGEALLCGLETRVALRNLSELCLRVGRERCCDVLAACCADLGPGRDRACSLRRDGRKVCLCVDARASACGGCCSRLLCGDRHPEPFIQQRDLRAVRRVSAKRDQVLLI